MLEMPRPRPPCLVRQRARNGDVIWYFRIGKGPRTRIRGNYGSPEFLRGYEAALGGKTPKKSRGGKAGTVEWLIAQYRASAPWTRLSSATRRQRDNIFVHIIERIGDTPFAEIHRKDIAASRDARRATPFAARNFLKTMRGLFRWALEAGMVKQDPTDGVAAPEAATEGFVAWSEAEIEKFEAHWPIGSRERLALAILLYTGLRRGDAVRLGRPHVRDGVITLRPEKTGPRGPAVVIPMLAVLERTIAASPAGELTFIATKSGLPMTKEGFGNWFREACKVAGVPGSAHGLRKAGATRAANNGATVAELEAIFGWTGGKMASLYTRGADRVRLARQAIGKMENADEPATPIPSHRKNAPRTPDKTLK